MNDQRDRFWEAMNAISDRVRDIETTVDQRKEVMRETIKEAVQEAMPSALLSEEEHRWVQLAIKRESQSIDFRRAVIEKSLAALAWSAVVGAGYILKEYLANHGLKL